MVNTMLNFSITACPLGTPATQGPKTYKCPCGTAWFTGEMQTWQQNPVVARGATRYIRPQALEVWPLNPLKFLKYKITLALRSNAR